MPTVEVAGLTIGYEDRGQGPPIVLVHGGASDAREWHFQIDDLADQFRVVAWDEPGNGRSSDLPAGWGLADAADALAGLMTTLELGPAHVGGLSWGGVVALELYRRHREAVGTLILTGTYAGWKGSLPPDEVAARVAAFERSIEDQSQSVAGFFPGLFATDPLPPRIAELMAAMDEGVRRPTLEALIPAVAAADFSEMLPLIDVPTLLIWGEADVRSPVLTVGHQFRNAIPGAHMVVLEGAGHMSQMEAPEAFNRAVREFCSLHGLEPDTSGTSR